MSCGVQEAFVFGMGMIAGTGTTLTGKVMYGIDSVGLDGTVKKFEKPIFQTWGMFFAMVFALPIHWAYTWYIHRNHRSKLDRGLKCTYLSLSVVLNLTFHRSCSSSTRSIKDVFIADYPIRL